MRRAVLAAVKNAGMFMTLVSIMNASESNDVVVGVLMIFGAKCFFMSSLKRKSDE